MRNVFKYFFQPAQPDSFDGRIALLEDEHRLAETVWNSIISVVVLIITVLLAEICYTLHIENQIIIMIYLLAVLIIARFTQGYVYGICAAVGSTVLYDLFITKPRIGFSVTIGFPITLLSMLVVSLITCTVTTQMKRHAQLAQEREYRIKQMYETNQRLAEEQRRISMEAEKEKMRATLLQAISHDLRTPLTGILGAGSTIKTQCKQLPLEEISRLGSDIMENSQWLIRMVENLLAVTRIAESTMKVQKTLEVAEEVMAQSVTIVRKRFPECNIQVITMADPLIVPMDATLIAQVLINLLENAVKYSPVGSPITLKLRKEENCVRFDVSDHGKGIPDEIADSLFETQTPSQSRSVDSVSGIGIGLPICKTIVHAHDGKIIGKNRANGGAVFSIILPLEGAKPNE